ncbi:TPA: TetR/AcrR family transcriptional regulator [Klebsiella pneumoniae]|uniref:TetR/AcrR family transcriptional regulator n=1 Tax=Gammaproteobacteria TaxID=1236 RepID=UPI001681253B|nr:MULTISPECIES: TetR/AcrR family transcriptional regulator [Gammaproteobacteria]HBT5887492.1 TetR/AcrR family transcriptional regulator [Klebsiella quasipneumoniae]HCI6318587.1 TetR/AcrR family transcriptional regulator [Klebsiella quasipneumoniae subsp. similipneumoniae]HBN8507766.1 TetR/AcrR family transcriptional regulator [Pseudomonas aeruginosa]HBR5509842.1 TetR/AcrR family transcriptional regulator [Klebsiella pneumoniae]HBT5137679.1 TetR/AcrR family transcriptional regulator [Klebsiell
MSLTMQQAKSAETRERILQSALSFIEANGYEKLTLQKVAVLASLTTGAVQHHFQSKADLRLHILERLARRVNDSPGLRPALSLPLDMRIQQVVKTLWEEIYSTRMFSASWSTYLESRFCQEECSHIALRRDPVMEAAYEMVINSIPEINLEGKGRAHAAFTLSALRGIGLIKPFTASDTVDLVLRQILEYLRQAATPISIDSSS